MVTKSGSFERMVTKSGSFERMVTKSGRYVYRERHCKNDLAELNSGKNIIPSELLHLLWSLPYLTDKVKTAVWLNVNSFFSFQSIFTTHGRVRTSWQSGE